MELTLGYAGVPPRDLDWLLIAEQRLLEFTSGAIFTDPLQLISPYRQAFTWYPENVWRYRLAYAWECIGWELDLVWLCGRRGDALSMQLNAAKTVERLMRLTFLLARRYAPGYSKWLEREFSKLPGLGEQLKPWLSQASSGADYRQITESLHKVIEILYQCLIELDLVSDLPAKPPLLEGRGFSKVDVQHIARCILASVGGSLGKLTLHEAPLGAVDQWLRQEDILLSPEHLKAMAAVYAQPARNHGQIGDNLI
jgi:hypothetical protein